MWREKWLRAGAGSGFRLGLYRLLLSLFAENVVSSKFPSLAGTLSAQLPANFC